MTGLKRILHSRRGFTLVELVVVLVILGVTASVGVPALTGYIDNAKEKQAVSETQACVETATRLAAAKYAEYQHDSLTPTSTGATAETLSDWHDTVGTAPAVTTGTIALTEGSGTYYLNVPSPAPAGASQAHDVAADAGVSGHVSQLTCNANGQVLYLVYTSADSIQVVYTATGTAANVKDNDDGTIVVPKPDATPTPTPATPTPTPVVKKLRVYFDKVDADDGTKVIGAKLKVTDGTAEWSWTSGNNRYYLDLPVGDYTYQEEEAPDGYLQASDISFRVYEESDGQLYVTGDNATTTATSATITMKDKKTPEEKTTTITFVKQDSYTEKNLAGAQLRIVDTSGNIWYSWTSEADTSPKYKLPAGSYYYEEVSAPAHYNKADPIPFTINQKLELSCDVDGAKTDSKKLTMVDKVETTTVVFWASDEAHNNLSGVPMQITGDLLGARKDSDRHWVSDSSVGHTLELPLVPGTYYFRVEEKQDKFDYTDFVYDTPTWITFEVDSEGNVTLGSSSSDGGEGYIVSEGADIGLHLICKTKSRPLNSVSLFKRDTAGKALAGAKFTITDTVTDRVVAFVTSSGTDNESMTKGLSNSTLVYYNKIYCLHETDAPDGYKLADDVYFRLALENSQTVLYSSAAKSGPFTLASEGGKYIAVTDEKKSASDGFDIVADDSTTITITFPKLWPMDTLYDKGDPIWGGHNWSFKDEDGNDTFNVWIRKGDIYYHTDADGNTTYYYVKIDQQFGIYSNAGSEAPSWFDPTVLGNFTGRIEPISSSSKLLTAHDSNLHYNSDYTDGTIYPVSSGDLLLYDGKLYMFSAAGDTAATFPPSSGNWYEVSSDYYTLSTYIPGADPLGEQHGYYKEFLKNN